LETALNLVWFGVSAALLLIGSMHVMSAGKDRSRGMAAVAMICLICLLFPVISMTDDLNSGSLALLEPNKVKKLLSVSCLLAMVMPWLVQPPAEFKSHVARLEFESDAVSQQVLTFPLYRRPPPYSS